MVDSRGSEASIRLEPEQNDLGGSARRPPEALSDRLRHWSRALWAPVWWRVGLALVTLGAIAMLGARAQGEPRGTAVLKITAPDPSPPPGGQPSSPVRPVPCVAAPPQGGEPSKGREDTAVAHSEAGQDPSGRLVLNTASASELDRLPGVGPKRAEEIVKLRERLGRFRRLSDLLRVRGVGQKTLKKWQDLVVIDPPPQLEPKPENPAPAKAP